MNDFRYVACAPPSCTCPVIDVEDGIVYIADDYQHVVQMTMEEMYKISIKFLAECIKNNFVVHIEPNEL